MNSASTGSTGTPLVSVLVLSYARPELLRATTRALRRLEYPAIEYVLADDGSPRKMQEEMRDLPYDRFVFSRANRGLGANENAGLAACNGSLILQVQDDWTFKGPSDVITRAVSAFQEVESLGLLRLALVESLRELPRSETHVLLNGNTLHLIAPPGPERGEDRRWLYSDTPHMKRRAMVEALGPYLEAVPMQWSEVAMRERFLECDRFAAGWLEVGSVFRHDGATRSHRRQSTVQVAGQRLLTCRVAGRAVRAALGAYSRTVSRIRRLVSESESAVVRNAEANRPWRDETETAIHAGDPGS